MQRVRLGGLAAGASPSSSIGSDDLLTVRVVTGLQDEQPLEHKGRVGGDGSFDMPLVGQVLVAGLEPGDAADQIAAAAVARGVFLRPQVSVEVSEAATNRVTVLGAVADPGVKELPRSGCDVLSAIAAAGGLDEKAGAVVELLRSGQGALADASTSTPADGVRQVVFDAPAAPGGRGGADLIDLAKPESLTPNRMSLGDRDVIIVRPKQQRVVHVTGLVRNPKQFELLEEHDMRLLDAIALAGGASSSIADKVLVVRQRADGEEPVVIEASIARAKSDGAENLILQSGDLVSVESTPATVISETFNNLFRITMGVAAT